NDANYIKPLARFRRSQRQRPLQCMQSVVRIISNENYAAQRFWVRHRFGEKHYRAGRFSHKTARDVAQKRMQHHFLLKSASDYHVDPLTIERAQNGFSWVSFSLFIMNH